MTVQQVTYQVVNKASSSDDDAIVTTISSGMKNTGGYKIEIDRVEFDDSTSTLTVFAKEIPPKGMVTMAFSTPSTTIRINKKKSECTGGVKTEWLSKIHTGPLNKNFSVV